MGRRDDQIERLRSVKLFGACSKADLHKIARLGGELEYEAGTTVITEGEIAHEFFVIIEGTATVTRKGRAVAKLGPGDSFGELALLDPQPRAATVTARSDLDLLVMGRREFMGLIDEAPLFARKLLSALARRLHAADAQAIH